MTQETKKRKPQIMLVRSVQLISKDEIKMLGEDQLKFSVGMELLTQLQQTNVIKYNMEEEHDGNVKYTAELKVIYP